MAQLTEDVSRRILARFGAPISGFRVAESAEQARSIAQEFGCRLVVKALVPTGGRSKAGAVVTADTPADAERAFVQVTHSPVSGLLAHTALIEPWVAVARELYLAITVDPATAGTQILFSAVGGVDIESSGQVVRIATREDRSVNAADLYRVASQAGVPVPAARQIVSSAQAMARVFDAYDAQLVESNPLGLVGTGIQALDVRIVIDDNALYRQPELKATLHDTSPRFKEDLVREIAQLEYVELDGNIGLISGGAGLTMATIDLIADSGGAAACFLDCSANPTPNGYRYALDLMETDPKVRSILVSIFGGLTQVDRVARTFVQLFDANPPKKPLTMRLNGTNVDEATKLLGDAGIVNRRTLEDAVRNAVAEARGSRVGSGR